MPAPPLPTAMPAVGPFQAEVSTNGVDPIAWRGWQDLPFPPLRPAAPFAHRPAMTMPVPRAEHERLVAWHGVYDRIREALGDAPRAEDALRRALPRPDVREVTVVLMNPWSSRFERADPDGPLVVNDPALQALIDRALELRARIYLDTPALRPLLDSLGPRHGGERVDLYRRIVEKQTLEHLVDAANEGALRVRSRL